MNRSVMIVDDEPYIRLAVKKVLERKGICVHTADGGRECLNILEKGFKGVILMDIMMPEMDGWDTVKEIVKRGYDEGTIIFMLTALKDPGEKLEELQEHVVDYITKPFDPDNLTDIVEYYLCYNTSTEGEG